MEIKPWFEPGFDEIIKATILRHWPQNATVICHDEAHRWAKFLLELNSDCDVELNDGMFHIDGNPSDNRGHTWLAVKGCIFDPTAAQFDGSLNPSYYAAFDCCSGEDLLQRLSWWFHDRAIVRTANSELAINATTNDCSSFDITQTVENELVTPAM